MKVVGGIVPVDAAGLASRIPALEWIENAREALARARTLEGVAELAEQAQAAQALLELQQSGSHAHAEAWALVQEAKRRFGELSRQLPKAKRGRKGDGDISPADGENGEASKTERLAELSVPSARASEAERIAALDEDEFRARVAAGEEAIKRGDRPKPLHAASSAVGYESDECSTPPDYVEPVREVLDGVIGCDPFSNAYAQSIVQAQCFYTKQDSAFEHAWTSDARTLFFQPPYSAALIKQAVAEYHRQLEARNWDASVGLVNSCTETDWFQWMLGSCDAVCFPKKRIQFWYRGEPIKGSNRYAQAFFYTGPAFKKFVRTFSPIGAVLVSHSRRPRS